MYSPLPVRALAVAARVVLRREPDPGRARAELEALLRRRYNAERAIPCGSGTQALQLGLRLATGIQPAPVAAPAFSCYEVAAALVGAGVQVAFYDVDPETLAPDWDSLDAALSSGARTALIAPLYGVPVDWDRLETVVQRHGAAVIEDAAQGHGAFWRDRPLGSLAPMSILSFGRGKGWTGGCGGALLLRGEAVATAAALPALAPAEGNAGIWLRGLAQWAFSPPLAYGIPTAIPGLGLGQTVYHEPRSPKEMPTVAAVLAAATVEAADAEAARRRERGNALLATLRAASAPGLVTPPAQGRPGWLRFPLRVSGGIGAVGARTAARLGMAASYPLPLPALQPRIPLQPVDSSSVGDAVRRFPGADRLSKELLTLPTHSHASDEEFAALVDAILCAARGAGMGP